MILSKHMVESWKWNAVCRRFGEGKWSPGDFKLTIKWKKRNDIVLIMGFIYALEIFMDEVWTKQCLTNSLK
jgi:hypothetical protein